MKKVTLCCIEMEHNLLNEFPELSPHQVSIIFNYIKVLSDTSPEGIFLLLIFHFLSLLLQSCNVFLMHLECISYCVLYKMLPSYVVLPVEENTTIAVFCLTYF